MELVNKKINIFGDEIGFIELWDNSKGNFDDESRVNGVTTVASVCFNKDKAKNPNSLYSRLERESIGLPSSSFEFVPILLGNLEIIMLNELQGVVLNKTKKPFRSHCLKYGELVLDNEGKIKLLTNLRALLYDNEYTTEYMNQDIKGWYNKEDEDIELMKKYYKLFKVRVPIFVARQIMRHRINLQERSLRFSRGDLEFYKIDTPNYGYDKVEEEYNKLLKSGLKAEQAREILPVSLYTTIWMGFPPSNFENFINLRTDSHTQEATRKVAGAMKELTKGE